VKKILIHTGERGSRIEEPLRYAGYTVVGIQTTPRRKFMKFLDLIKIIITEAPHVIIVDSAGLMCVSAFVLSTIFRIPLALRVRADIWAIYEEQTEYCSFARRVYELILVKVCTAVFKRSTRLFPVSEYLKGVMIEKGIKKEKIGVLRISVDCERFHPAHTEGPLTLLSVNNFTFKRKTEGLLDALPVVDDVLSTYGNVVYVIAGRGIFSTRLKEALKTVKNKDRISYIGYEKAIETLFSKADIFLHHSYLDAYPVAVLEAMASGLPVIARRCGGIGEQVQEGVTGFLVDDLPSFQKALVTLIEDRKMRKEMGEKSRSKALEQFDISLIAEGYKKEIDKISS
jgi:glycosyltransferase involved in cell wall biosynthesis